MIQARRHRIPLLTLALAVLALAGAAVFTLTYPGTMGLAGTAAATPLPFTPQAEEPLVVNANSAIRFDVFVRSSDGKLWNNWHDTTWHNWTEVANGLKTPAAGAATPGNIDFVYIAGDGNVWGRENRNGDWGAFYNLGQPPGGAHQTSALAVAHGGPGNLNVFVRGATDNKLWHRKHTGGGTATGAWDEVASNVASEPFASLGGGRMDVVYRDGNGKVAGRWHDGAWKDKYDLGAPAGGALTGLGVAAGTITLEGIASVKTANGRTWAKRRNASAWDADWFDVAGGMPGDPAAVATYGVRYDLVYRAGDGKIWGRYFQVAPQPSGWKDWYDIGQPPGGSTAHVGVAVNGNQDSSYVIARSADNKFYARTWDGSAWQAAWVPIQNGSSSSPQPKPELFIAEHPNLQGTGATITYDIPDMTPWDPGMRRDNTISSVRVLNGAKAALYEHPGYRGRCITVTSDIPDLRTVGFDDALSSLRFGSGCDDWYVSEIKVSASGNDGQARAGCNGYTLIPQDLNEGAGGDSVYLCLKFGPASNAIKYLRVLNTDDGQARTGSDGVRRGLDCKEGTKDPTDLNNGAGGDYIYFCYGRGAGTGIRDVTFDVRSTAAIHGFSTGECITDYLGGPDNSGKRLWSPVGKDGNSQSDSIDVNKDAGGKYIYPCVK